MSPNKILYGVVGVLVALGIILGVASCTSSCKQGVADRAAIAGAEAKGGSKALQAEAKATGAQADEQTRKVDSAAAAVEKAKEGLQKLRKLRPAPIPLVEAQGPQDAPVPAQPPLVPEVPDNRDAIISQQELVIQALDQQVKELQTRDLMRVTHIRQLDGALKLETEARIQAEMRAKAMEGVARANLWKGRAQGFLAGVGVGGLGGVALSH